MVENRSGPAALTPQIHEKEEEGYMRVYLVMDPVCESLILALGSVHSYRVGCFLHCLCGI